MQPTSRPVTQSLLNADLNDLAHSLVREMAMAFRKVSIYGPSHPLSLRSLEKPLLIFRQFFRFRRYVALNVQRGILYVGNIAIKESVFNTQIMQNLQLLEMHAILFDESMTANEFHLFVSTVVSRERQYDARFSMAAHLRKKGIASITVNTEQAFDLFENRKQYRGDVDGDFSIKRMALDAMGTSLDRLTRLNGATVAQLLEHRIDFWPDVISYLLPERLVALPWQDIRRSISDLVREINQSGGTQSGAVEQYMAIFKLIELHPERAKIISDLELPAQLEMRKEAGEDFTSPSGKIRIEANRRIDQLLEMFFSLTTATDPVDISRFTEFGEAYSRLLKTGQGKKAVEVLIGLVNRLSDSESFVRQKSLDLLVMIINDLNLLTDIAVLEATVNTITSRLFDQKESYEYSELVLGLWNKCLTGKRYDLLSHLLVALASRRQIQNGVTAYDSMTIKKAFENVNRAEVITLLMDDLLKARNEDAGHIKTILIAIGSEEIALALAQIISHPLRQVRQLSLKILAELGKNSLKVFSDMLVDDGWFERDKERHELPDAKWYVIRNTIFVLGSLRDKEGVVALRLRITDPDIRVRREIISALEKIGGDDAIDLLVIMAEDPDREIREAALAGIGIIGTPEYVPLVIDLVNRNPADAVRSLATLGKIGGDEARTFLGQLMGDDETFNQLAAGKISREDLRVAVVRALGSLGDHASIEKIRAFQKGLTAAQKLLLRGSSIQKVITEVLSRH